MDYRKLYKDHYGIEFDADMEVHHIDQDRENNVIHNLLLLPAKLHQEWHIAKSAWESVYKHSDGIFDVFSLSTNSTYLMSVGELQEFIEARNRLIPWVEWKRLLDMEKRGEMVGALHYRPFVK